MKTRIRILLMVFCTSFIFPISATNTNERYMKEPVQDKGNAYTLIITGYDWGPGVNKVILHESKIISQVNASDYEVVAERGYEGVEITPDQASGKRHVLYAYVSDEKGNRVAKGKHITLALLVGPEETLGNPIQYIFQNNQGSNHWVDYSLSITEKSTGEIWNREKGRIQPLVDRFDLSGSYTHKDGTALTYASFEPTAKEEKRPLIIWLHGGGEGGTDPSIPLVANKATNYASKKIQGIFGGAYVLVPQTPTFWMQSASGAYTRGKENDIYNDALMGLIKKYVTDRPNIDADRVYIGGCSNGGYMSLKLLLEHPNYFAAAYISALAYHAKYISDVQLEIIQNKPIWFLHCKDDQVTVPDETVVPLYRRLKATGAPNVHFSYYDHAVDLTGFYGGDGYRYNGHFSWIYSHANHADFDFDGSPVRVDGKPVNLMNWMALQRR